MQDRSSSTAWFVALGIDIVLCIYLAVSVVYSPPQPPPGLRDAEVPRADEIRCGRPYLNRLLGAVDSIERELWSAVDERAQSENDGDKRTLQIRIEDLNDRLQRIHMAYVDCDEVRRADALAAEAATHAAARAERIERRKVLLLEQSSTRSQVLDSVADPRRVTVP